MKRRVALSIPNIRVLTPLNTQRLGLQNRMVRKLREMGCKVLETTLDSRLTIRVEPSAGSVLRRHASCIVSQRATNTDVVSIEMEGCLIKWTERKA
jgi:hypothetical protein